MNTETKARLDAWFDSIEANAVDADDHADVGFVRDLIEQQERRIAEFWKVIKPLVDDQAITLASHGNDVPINATTAIDAAIWNLFRARERDYERIADLKAQTLQWEQEIAAKDAEIERLREALRLARTIIKDWRGRKGWNLYQESPEMRAINEALGSDHGSVPGTHDRE